MYWNDLGLRLGDRFSHTGAMADLQEAKQNSRTALNSQNASITIGIGADRCFMSTPDILEDAPLACDIANVTIDLIPLSAPGSLIRRKAAFSFMICERDSLPMPQQLRCMLVKSLSLLLRCCSC